MKRVTVFAKGNVDLRDSLLFSSVNRKIVWNGINEIVSARHPAHTLRVVHETATHFCSVPFAASGVPEDLRSHTLVVPHFPLSSQFETRLFTSNCNAVVLSLLADVFMPRYRHREYGYLLWPDELSAWPVDEQRWFKREFEELGRSSLPESMQALERIIAALRRARDVPILVYNLSSVIPGEDLHSHAGMEEALSTRIRRFNLGLVDLSATLGFSVVDVDHILARAGADSLKISPWHLRPEGYRLVAEEVARVLEDYGVFDDN